MSDRFDDFIRSNRDEFDSFAPPANGWNQISEKIHSKPNALRKRLYIISSSVAAAAIIAFVVMFSIQDPNQNNMAATYENIPELNEATIFYQTQINEHKAAIAQLASDHPDMVNEMNTDLAALDTALLELKQDLKDNISNEEIIEAMIQNYRMKLMILEDIMVYLDNQKQENNAPIKQSTYEL